MVFSKKKTGKKNLREVTWLLSKFSLQGGVVVIIPYNNPLNVSRAMFHAFLFVNFFRRSLSLPHHPFVIITIFAVEAICIHIQLVMYICPKRYAFYSPYNVVTYLLSMLCKLLNFVYALIFFRNLYRFFGFSSYLCNVEGAPLTLWSAVRARCTYGYQKTAAAGCGMPS